MKLSEYLSKNNKYPILFIGSGISKRYMNTPDWENLLKSCFEILGYTIVDYRAKINCLKQNGIDDNEILLHLAEEMIQEYEANYKELDDISEVTRNVANIVTTKEKNSRFKELVCQIISEYKKDEENGEIRSFRKMNSKVYTFVTTNYDNFLSDLITDRENIIGNNVILKEPLKSIYKIHGCVSDSDSIVIGAEDYTKFKENNILLFSQLISFCINHPIIFLGYSLSDNNVKEILETIFSFVKPNSEEYEKLKNNFLIIERKENEMDTILVDKMYQLGDNTITIKAVETDNFKAVYENISDLEIPMAISELRRLKNITKKIELVEKDAPKFKVRNSMDSSSADNLVLMLSSARDIIPINVKTSDIIDQYWGYELDDESCKSIGIHTLKTLDVQAQQYFPCHIFKEHNTLYLEQQQNNLKSYYESIKDKSIIKKSINEILSDEELKGNKTRRLISIYVNVYLGNIPVDELKKYLENYLSTIDKTNYNRLLTLYDYLQYK